jgi:Cu-Zn family superoxide dismutase
MKPVRTIASLIAIVAIALLGSSSVHAQDVTQARATINSCTDGTPVGEATLFEERSDEGVKNVRIILTAHDLTPGRHAVHIHEVGQCVPCSAAMSHLDLGPFGNNVPVIANHPFHSGDLINVEANKKGHGTVHHVSSRFALSEGRLSIFDADGAAVVIHALPDAYCAGDPTDPNCAGGGRVACGVIEPFKVK